MLNESELIAKDIRIEECGRCGSTNMEKTHKNMSFDRRDGDSIVTLHAYVPVFTCLDCGAEFCNPLCMMKCHEAVCRYLGVLTPLEIRQIRESHELTQEGFADSLGIDVALMKLLEKGGRIQSYSVDKVLRSMD